MSAVGDWAKSQGTGILGGIGSGIAGGLGSVVSGGIQSLFGMGYKKRLEQQEEYQKRLMAEQYKYQNMLASEQYMRELGMYERSKKDQSYQERVKQMKEAGVNPALMYGMGSGGGGGAGSLGGGGGLGSVGIPAGSAGEIMSMSTNSALRGQEIELQRRANEADVKLKEAQAKSAEEQAGLTRAQRETEDAIRDVRVELEKQTGFEKWSETVRRRYEDLAEQGEDGMLPDYTESNDVYGEWHILGKALRNKQVAQEFYNTQIDGTLKYEQAGKTQAERSKVKEESKKIAEEIEQLILNGQAERAYKRAQTAAEWANERGIRLENGDEVNWKTWVSLGLDVIKATTQIATMIGGVKAARATKGILKNLSKKGNKSPEMNEYAEEWASAIEATLGK